MGRLFNLTTGMERSDFNWGQIELESWRQSSSCMWAATGVCVLGKGVGAGRLTRLTPPSPDCRIVEMCDRP